MPTVIINGRRVIVPSNAQDSHIRQVGQIPDNRALILRKREGNFVIPRGSSSVPNAGDVFIDAPRRVEDSRRVDRFGDTKTMDVSLGKEELAMERHLRETDRRVLDSIERCFGSHIPKNRLERVRKQAAHFLRHREYQEHLCKNGIEVEENVRILRDIDKNEAWVDREHMLTPKTLAHECFHQLSDRLYVSMLGSRINEVTSEYLALKGTGDPHPDDVGSCYPEETGIVEMLSARVGDETIADLTSG